MRKRGTISLETKYMIVERLEAQVKRSDIKKEFNIKARQTIHQIWNNRTNIKQRYEAMRKKDTKNASYIRQSNFPQVEKSLILWIKQMDPKQQKTITGPMIREKAKEFAYHFGITHFKASDGFIAGLKKRYSFDNLYNIELNNEELDPLNHLEIQCIESESSVNEQVNEQVVEEVNEQVDEDVIEDISEEVTTADAFSYLTGLKIYFMNRGNSKACEQLQNIEIELMKTHFMEQKQNKNVKSIAKAKTSKIRNPS